MARKSIWDSSDEDLVDFWDSDDDVDFQPPKLVSLQFLNEDDFYALPNQSAYFSEWHHFANDAIALLHIMFADLRVRGEISIDMIPYAKLPEAPVGTNLAGIMIMLQFRENTPIVVPIHVNYPWKMTPDKADQLAESIRDFMFARREDYVRDLIMGKDKLPVSAVPEQ